MVLGVIAAGFLALLLKYTLQRRSVPPQLAMPPPAEIESVEDKTTARLDLNSAGLEELETLPGIGPSLAARILEYRLSNGPFASPDELVNVRGIGEKKLERLRGLIECK